ncbi:uncharacterized protein LOC115565080 [Drosophila navojoa]|uniref:uncharacterized protein LOC115565080 n=1 Tax=Drosophila navojoa TaxID=7232 RepID=UPI000847B483|nr:uncharacterized protein LOC115565080 [Drosophila navojoa]
MQKAQDHKHHHSDKKVNVHLENGKVHQRIHKLMQLQQQMDDTEPTPFTPQKLRNYQFGQSRHRRSGVHNFDDMRPPRASTYTHPVYGARVKQVASDTQAYTPAHKDSDNGDIFAKSRAQAIMMRQSKSEQFPSKRTARPIGGESAMYRLCKGLLLRNVISKY